MSSIPAMFRDILFEIVTENPDNFIAIIGRIRPSIWSVELWRIVEGVIRLGRFYSCEKIPSL